MRNLLIALLAALALLTLSAFIVPALIDWNAHKPRITGELERLTGRAVAIEGDLKFRLLPRPRVSAERVQIANLPGGSEATMVSARAVEFRLGLWPLLVGRFEVEQAFLVAPRILLERVADGRGNWDLGPAAAGTTAPGRQTGVAGEGPDIAIRDLRIEQGSLLYRDPAVGDLRFEAVAGRLALETRSGPLSFKGGGKTLGQSLQFELVLGRFRDRDPIPASLSVRLKEVGESRLDFTGRLLPRAEGLAAEGRLTAGGESLAALVALFEPAVAAPTLARPFSLQTEVGLDAKAVAARDVTLRLGPTMATGEADLRFGPQPEARVLLALPRLDLDEFLAASEGAGKGAVAAEPAAGGATAEGGGGAGGPGAFALPERLRLDFKAGVEAIVYRGQILRQAQLDLLLDGGLLEVREARSLLPGSAEVTLNGSLAADGGQPRFTGRIEMAADNLRGLASWLGLEFSEVPTARLRRATLSGTLDISPSLAKLTELRAEVDTSRLSGGIAVALRKRLGFGLGIAIDRLNLDAYLPEKAGGPSTGGAPAGAAAGAARFALPPYFTDFDANLDLRIGEITLAQQAVTDLQLDATLQQGKVTLRRLSVAELAGGRGELSGVVNDATSAPQVEWGNFAFGLKDSALFARFLGLPGDGLLARVGPLEATGRFSGTPAAFDYSLEATLLEGALGSSGKLADLPQSPRVTDGVLAFERLTGARLARLLALPGDGFLARLGTLAGRLTYEGSLESLAYDADLSLLEGRLAQKGVLEQPLAAPRLVKGTIKAEGLSSAALAAALGLEAESALARLDGLALEGSLSADRAAATYDLHLAALSGELALAGSAAEPFGDRPDFRLTAKLTHPDLSQLLDRFAGSGGVPPGLGPLRLEGGLSGGLQGFAVTGLTGVAGPTGLAGEGEVKLGEGRPHIRASLRLEEAPLDLVLALAGGTGAVAGGGRAGNAPGAGDAAARWSREPYDLAALSGLDASFLVAARSLVKDDLRLEEAKLSGELLDGRLELEELSGRLAGGRIRAQGTLDGSRPAGGLALALAVALEEVESKTLLAALAGFERVSGPISLTATLEGRGRNEAELVERLEGEGRLSGRPLFALDREEQAGNLLLGLLSDRVKEVRTPAAAGELLVSAFGNKPARLSGGILMRRGVARSNGLKLEGEGAEARLAGVLADLPAWTLDLEAEVFAPEEQRPRFTVGLSGPLDQPNPRVKGLALEIQPGLVPVPAPAAPGEGEAKPPEKPSAEELIRGILRSLKQ